MSTEMAVEGVRCGASTKSGSACRHRVGASGRCPAGHEVAAGAADAGAADATVDAGDAGNGLVAPLRAPEHTATSVVDVGADERVVERTGDQPLRLRVGHGSHVFVRGSSRVVLDADYGLVTVEDGAHATVRGPAVVAAKGCATVHVTKGSGGVSVFAHDDSVAVAYGKEAMVFLHGRATAITDGKASVAINEESAEDVRVAKVGRR